MKLPEIFKNKIENNNSNNKIFIVKDNDEDEDIFAKLPVKVKLTTKDNIEEVCTIVAKTKHYLITSNNNVIYIKDFISIKKA